MNQTKRKGFTLVELLIAMALSVLVGGILYLLQSTGLSQVSKGMTRTTLESEMRRKMERLISDLRCAYEILEISPKSIKFNQHKTTGNESRSSDIELFTITYSLEKVGKKSVIMRTDSREEPTEIFSADHVEPEVFFPFFEYPGDSENAEPLFESFNMAANDSGQRKNISFIRIRLKARQNKEFVTLISAVTLRPAHQRILQPCWKFR